MKKKTVLSIFFIFLSVLACGAAPAPGFAKFSEILAPSFELAAGFLKQLKAAALGEGELKKAETALELRNAVEHRRILENEISLIEETVSILEKHENWKEKAAENEVKIFELETAAKALDIERLGYRGRYAAGDIGTEEYEAKVMEIGFERQKIMAAVHSLQRHNALLKAHGIKEDEELEAAINSLKDHLVPIREELEKTIGVIDKLRKDLEKTSSLVSRLKNP